MFYLFIGTDQYDRELLFDALLMENVKAVDLPYRIKRNWYIKFMFRLYKYCPMIREKLKRFYDNSLANVGDKDVVFIFFNPFIEMMSKTGYIRSLRTSLPNAYCVALFWDVANAKRVDYRGIASDFDRLYIYDYDEAIKMGIDYISPTISKKYANLGWDKEKYDISFVGQLKGRGDYIIGVYDYLMERGLRCHFYLVGVNKENRIPRAGVTYGDNFIIGEEAFAYTATARCLLDVRLPDTYALTARVREAIMYDKMLLTNNPRVKTLSYYNETMIQIFDCVKNIDISFFDPQKRRCSYEYKGDWSASRLLEQIENNYKMDRKI